MFVVCRTIGKCLYIVCQHLFDLLTVRITVTNNEQSIIFVLLFDKPVRLSLVLNFSVDPLILAKFDVVRKNKRNLQRHRFIVDIVLIIQALYDVAIDFKSHPNVEHIKAQCIKEQQTDEHYGYEFPQFCNDKYPT